MHDIINEGDDIISIYDIKVKDRSGNDVSLDKFKGKVLLIVNTATGCGFTPQYEGLEQLYEKYNEKGLEILDFPCDQFGHQAPGTNDEIHEFCTLKYNTKFDQFAKIEVNGKNESPLYTFLKNEQGGLIGKKIKWNFTKFLVDKDGKVINRFAPTVEPLDIEKNILELL